MAVGRVPVAAGDVIDVAQGPVVVDIGIPSTTFDEEILPYLEGADVADGLDLFDMPWFAVGMIGARAVARIRAGQGVAAAARAAGPDATRAGAALLSGKLATVAGWPESATAAVGITVGMTVTAGFEVGHTWQAGEASDSRLARLADIFIEKWH